MREWLKDHIWAWRARRGTRQAARCAAGKHHWKSDLDRVICRDPGCGRRYGQ